MEPRVVHVQGNAINTTQSMCMAVLPWFPRNHWPLAEFPFMTLLLQFLIVFCLTQAFHRGFFQHFGIPPLVSQLVAGICLSPTVYIGGRRTLSKAHELIFPPASDEVWRCVGMLGYGLSLFLIAVKMDFTIISRTGNKKPIVLGLLVLVITYVTNSMVAFAYVRTHFDPTTDVEQILDLASVATLTALTAFPVIAAILEDLGLLNSELGRLALSAGMICDLTSIILNMVSKTITGAIRLGVGERNLAVEVGKSVGVFVYLLLVAFVLRFGLKWMIKKTPKGRPVNLRCVYLVIMLALFGGLITDACEEHVLLGFFAIGAAIPEGPPLGSAIVEKLDFFVLQMLLPFFITTAAMKANVLEIAFRGDFARGYHLLVFLGYATKTGICLLCGYFFNMAIPDALALAVIMTSKGFVDIGNLVMFKQSKLIGDETYSYLILVTTVAAIVVPMAIQRLYHPQRKYAGYEKRSIMHCKNDSQLRVLACVFRPDNVPAITKFLTLSSPSKANSMIVDVLHLMKLVGRAQPISIAHDLQQTISSCSKFEDIIWAFNSFKMDYTPNVLSMHFFTKVSPPTAMSEDVCSLALHNSTSLIILPFHRKINMNGQVEQDDYAQRTLNKTVLDLAPCSVGILVNRGYKKLDNCSSSRARTTNAPSRRRSRGANEEDVLVPLEVAVIFIGGKDDQEAVAYAKRIANARVKVRIINLVALKDDENHKSLLDGTALSGIIRENSSSNASLQAQPSRSNVLGERGFEMARSLDLERASSFYEDHISCTETTVKDAPSTARYVRSIVEDFDLMIVGRRLGHEEDCIQTLGLHEWSEIPELGVLGDLLAQPDLKCRASVLVIQQQKQWTFKNDDASTKGKSNRS